MEDENLKYKNKSFRKADKIVIVDKKNLFSMHEGMIRVAVWDFDKKMIFENSDGTSSEFPKQETVLIISKKNTSIWLMPEEVSALKQMLDEITIKSVNSIIKNCEVKA